MVKYIFERKPAYWSLHCLNAILCDITLTKLEKIYAITRPYSWSYAGKFIHLLHSQKVHFTRGCISIKLFLFLKHPILFAHFCRKILYKTCNQALGLLLFTFWSLICRLRFALRFWNQTSTCRSVNAMDLESSILRFLVRYRWSWNCLSNSIVWYVANCCRLPFLWMMPPFPISYKKVFWSS